MKNIKFYAEDERYEATVTYGDGLKVRHNGEERLKVVSGDKVTVVGEFVITSNGDYDHGKELKQLVFMKEDARTLGAMHEDFLKEVPKEKLELGDYVRVKWVRTFGEDLYIVDNDAAHGGYYLTSIGKKRHAFSHTNVTSDDLLKKIKESSVVDSYEILPKDEYKLGVVKK